MKPVLAALALSTLVLLAGCGGTSAEDDPFVGTWRPVGGTDASGSLVIAKGSGGYEAFLVSKKPALAMGPMLLRRHGNQLVFGVMSSSSADCTHGECRLEECTWCLLNPRVRPQAPTKAHVAIRRDVPRVSKKPHPATRFRCKLGSHPKARACESTYHPFIST